MFIGLLRMFIKQNMDLDNISELDNEPANAQNNQLTSTPQSIKAKL